MCRSESGALVYSHNCARVTHFSYSFQSSASTSRAVFILGSIAPYSNQSVVPQSPADLSDEDQQKLTELGLPPEKWDNLHARLAMYTSTKVYDVFSAQVSKPGMELSRKYVLEQIEFLLMNSLNKENGKRYYTVLFK